MDEMKEIIDDFLVEADELIASIDSNLVKLESRPGDLDLLNEIFRGAHTVKGTSSFLGFEQVTTLTHKMEDILNKLRKSELVVTPEVMDLLLESVDVLKVLLEKVRVGDMSLIDNDDLLNRLIAAHDGGSAAPPPKATKTP
ncbi:MAG: Hpt domain-containing protein, partial [candidate division Zixibacteria bacterium]|nr:Hpt domain-containing protein [candidate division Zixibacteria bacterium]